MFEYSEELRVKYPMTLGTVIGLPVILHIDRVDEAQHIVDGGILYFTCRSLRDDGMTQIAVLCNDLSFVGPVTVGVATETAIGFEMPDMVEIAA